MSAETAATLAAIGFLVIAVFQAALALGAPLGSAAWGGSHPGRLPAGYRIASGVAVAFWLFAALVVLARAGTEVVALPPALARSGTWVLVVLLPIGALMNLASKSRWERYLWGPLALVLAVLCVVVARSDLPS